MDLSKEYQASVPRPGGQRIEECKRDAEQSVRMLAQDSVRLEGWPKCKRCSRNLDLVVTSQAMPMDAGATAIGRWSKTCGYCGTCNGS